MITDTSTLTDAAKLDIAMRALTMIETSQECDPEKYVHEVDAIVIDALVWIETGEQPKPCAVS